MPTTKTTAATKATTALAMPPQHYLLTDTTVACGRTEYSRVRATRRASRVTCPACLAALTGPSEPADASEQICIQTRRCHTCQAEPGQRCETSTTHRSRLEHQLGTEICEHCGGMPYDPAGPVHTYRPEGTHPLNRDALVNLHQACANDPAFGPLVRVVTSAWASSRTASSRAR